MSTNTTAREERFEIDRRGRLVRIVTPKRGKPYRHSCTREVFKKICREFDVCPTTIYPCHLQEMASRLDVPHTQANVAACFLEERGLIDRETPRTPHHAESGDVYLDGMIEWLALADACDKNRARPTD